jgi:LysR family transcriptional regulator, nitrogen assimilation regulatory protein
VRLSQLETLINVAELGSLSRAAERLHVAQPALSRQVSMLERELGVQIFDRHGRGMVLTESGQEVLRHAYRVFGEIDEIRSVAAEGDTGLRGHLSVGLPPTVAEMLTLPLVSAMTDRHPNATLRVVSAYSRFLLDWLRRGDIDLAVLYEGNPIRTLRTVPLVDEELYLVGPPGSGLSVDTPVPFADLADARMLLPSRGHGLRNLLDAAAAEAGFELSVRIEADSYSTLKDLVKAGHGWMILPLAPIHDEIMGGGLSYAPLVDPTPRRRLVLAVSADRSVTRLGAFASEEMVTAVQRLAATGIWSGGASTDREQAIARSDT